MKLTSTLFFCIALTNSFADVSWKQQAKRLQNISTALTESIPVVTPNVNNSLDFNFSVSMLPSTNSLVGSKTEQIKTPPAHTVPTVKYNFQIQNQLKGSVWAGALPSFIANEFSEHTINQVIFGLEAQIFLKNSFYATYGYQLAFSEINGAITTSDYVDNLESISGVAYLGVGQNLEDFFWGVSAGARRNDSEFFIQQDDTTYKFSDQLEDSTIPLFSQITFGIFYKSFLFAFTQLHVPKRLLMPKVTLSYRW